MEQLKKQALLSWLSKVLHLQVAGIQQLRDGQLLLDLCNKIPGINIKSENKYEGWKDGYLRLKTLYEQIQNYMKNIIQYQFPNAVSTINLVQMAKGQDDQGLFNLLNLIILVTFNLGPKDSEVFINKVMQLDTKYQYQFMEMVKDNQVTKYEDNQMQQFEQKYERERQKVKQMLNVLQNLTMQNDSLKTSLEEQADQFKKLAQTLKKVQQQRDKFKKDYLQTLKRKQQEQQQPTQNVISQHHEQMVQVLKNQMIEQQQTYSQQIFELKQKIQILQEQLDIYKNKALELQQFSFKGTADHSNCVNRQTYKKQLNQLNAKLTQAASKQWKAKLENIRLQNLTEQLKQKNKKLLQETKNKQNNLTCSKNEANKLKFQFYSQIRDKLKQKIQNNVMLNAQAKKKQSHDNIQGIILDDPQIN